MNVSFLISTLALLASSSVVAGQNSRTCSANTRTYVVGSSFEIDCNNCFCAPGARIICTERVCSQQDGTRSYTKRHRSDKGGNTGCSANGRTYPVGTQYQMDCNICLCEPGNIPICTKHHCLTQTNKRKTTCAANGVRYQLGDRFMVRCNNCVCGLEGNVVCTERNCETLKCKHKGRKYKVGQKFRDHCKQCKCHSNGKVTCNKRICNGKDGIKRCTHNGKHYKPGDQFMIACIVCTCSPNGTIACNYRACFPLE